MENGQASPFTGWSIDFELFQNPQAGQHAGQHYLTWAGAHGPGHTWGPESVYIARVLSLRADEPTLSTYDNLEAIGWSSTTATGATPSKKPPPP